MDDKTKKALEKAKTKRKTLRSLATKSINKISDLLKDVNIDISDLEECFENLLQTTEQIFPLDLEIENLIDVTDLEKEVESNQKYRESIVNTKTKVKRYLSKSEASSASNKKSENIISENSNFNRINYEKPKILLPKLQIEQFDGNLEKFEEFWSQFKNAIHDNENLSKIDKYSYLKTFLKGAALTSIQGLLISESNYDLAVDLLKKRFGKREILIRTHIDRLLNLHPVKSTSQLKQLRDLYDLIEIQIRSLKNLDIELNSYGNLLFPLLIKLIPDAFALEFNRKHEESDSWNVEKLLAFLQKEIETREKTFSFRQNNEPKPEVNKYNANDSSFINQRYLLRNNSKNKCQKNGYKQESHPSAAALSTLQENCLFCNASDHKSEQCKKSQVEKMNALKQGGRCFICLRKNHLARSCISKMRCENCSRRHNILICGANSREDESKPETVTEARKTVDNMEAVMNSMEECGSGASSILQTARAEIENKCERSSLQVRVLFDLGSQRTFIKRKISREMNLPIIDTEQITVYAFGKAEPQTERKNRVSVTLRNPFDSKSKMKIEALETEVISGASIKIPDKNIVKICKEKGIKLSDTAYFENEEEEVSLLIGSDFYWKIVTGKIIRITKNLVAAETKLGWTVSGTDSFKNSTVLLNILQNNVVQNKPKVDPTSEMIKELWKLEALGIEDRPDEKSGFEEDIVYKNFRDTIQFVDNRYMVRLPWNENANELRDNSGVAEKRYQALHRKFMRNPEFHRRYANVINKHLSEGIAEESEYTQNNREYFMPHQAVIREDKDTTKLRVVFDASSHAENCLSLNDCLHSGPNLFPEILELLIKFRQHKIGITADIEAAFLQIALEPRDRNAVKFLWQDSNSEEQKVLRMTRVIFGAKSSPFLLGATLKFHIKKYESQYPKAFSLLNNCLYVDDLITGADTVREAIEESEDIKKILRDGSFNMRKWCTNEKSVETLWEKEHRETNKVLWNKEEDTLQIETSELIAENHKNSTASKREVLRIMSRLYDPLGFLSPFSVRARILLQEIWTHGLDWDDDLPQQFLKIWEIWREEFPEIQTVRVQRHYFDHHEKRSIENCQLHCFVDASEKAYGAVLYFKYEYKKEVKIGLVCSKSRVAPLKKLSLPRLELMAALIGVRLSKIVQGYVKEQIDIVPYFWSDSSIVLHWIKGSPERWKQFVQNRVREIQEKSDPVFWRHCPTKENPADLITRGSRIKDLDKNDWWTGPQWLMKPEENWPRAPVKWEEKETHKEKKKNSVRSIQASCIEEKEVNQLFDLEKFSNFNKVLRVTAWTRRFLNNAKNKEKQSGPLTAEEMKDSEIYWIKQIQQKSFPEELKALKRGKSLSQGSRIYMFNPFLDENQILRLSGRLHNADLTFSEKHPILLSENNYLAELIIRDSHEKTGHAGIAGTLSHIREKFWLIKGRQKVKNILRRCVTCQRFKSKPISQDIAPLPPDRVERTFPFEITGIDFAGPLYTKSDEKAYIALFTCAITRAVHLELLTNLSTSSFLLAFRRFIARRGLCKTVYTDNAKTFKKADRDLRKLWNSLKDAEVQDYYGKNGISWKFIAERAAWWGGFWERLVRSVKSCLKKIIGRASLSYQELEVVLMEVEAIINSRPLTYLFEDWTEPGPLSPAHFLIGRRMVTLPPEKTGLIVSTKDELTRRRVHQQKVTERLWKQWKKAYLLELRSAHIVRNPKDSPMVNEGSIVLVHDDKQPRLLWKMATVTERHEGRDGRVRACSLRLPNGTNIKRAVQHLYPLELQLLKTEPRLSGPECCERRLAAEN